MSAIVDASMEKTASRRIRKRSSGSRRRGPRADKVEGAEGSAPRERKERPVSIPVPPALVGSNQVGVVSAIIRKGRVKFGFIHLCPGPEIDESTPRIYFSFAALADPAVTIRRGYVVSFKVSADEDQRPFAEDIALTEVGKQIAAAKDAEIAARQAARPAGEDSERAPRAPRERRPQAEKPVTVKVTCEGKPGHKDLVVNVAQSVGKLKNVATTAWDAPIEFNVFHVDAGNHVFMTKAILVNLVDGDHVHLATPQEASA